jgi:hypothetical protein
MNWKSAGGVENQTVIKYAHESVKNGKRWTDSGSLRSVMDEFMELTAGRRDTRSTARSSMVSEGPLCTDSQRYPE